MNCSTSSNSSFALDGVRSRIILEERPSSTTPLPQRLTKELGAQFKNLLGWMGVKKATYPEALAEEWLRYGVANEGHRCELYAQVMST